MFNTLKAQIFAGGGYFSGYFAGTYFRGFRGYIIFFQEFAGVNFHGFRSRLFYLKFGGLNFGGFRGKA